MIHHITKFEVLIEDELKNRKREHSQQRQERTRSKSSVKRFFAGLIEGQGTLAGECIWKYGFEVTINERPYLFYVQTPAEHSLWVRIFSILIEMNERKIPVTLVNPFDYENYMKNKHR